MAADILDSVVDFCRRHQLLHPGERLVIGLSGGPDSLTLLHLLWRLRDSLDLTLTAAHLNHQLRGDASDGDAEFAAQVCRQWNVPLRSRAIDVATLAQKRGQTLEETGRQARYNFLWQVAAQTDSRKIAVGHHADDQAETVLMNFLRGSGLTGLRGMLPLTRLGRYHLHPLDSPPSPPAAPISLIRPLLDTPRTAIEQYCHHANLSPRHDESNRDTKFERNRLRHELLPLLETYNPNIRATLRRSAQALAADAAWLETELARYWPALIDHEADNLLIFRRDEWQQLPTALRQAALRRALARLQGGRLSNVGWQHIQAVLRLLNKEQTGAQASLPGNLRLTVDYETFVLAPADTPLAAELPDRPTLPPGTQIPLVLPGCTRLPGSEWALYARQTAAEVISPAQIAQSSPWEAYLDAASLDAQTYLRTRRPGDRFCPLGMAGHHQKLKSFMINQKIPARRRDTLPLLTTATRILWVCGARPAHEARVRKSTRQIIYLSFQKSTDGLT